MEIDPGGIGKGYAVDRMVEMLKDDGIRTALVVGVGQQHLRHRRAPDARPRGWKIDDPAIPQGRTEDRAGRLPERRVHVDVGKL